MKIIILRVGVGTWGRKEGGRRLANDKDNNDQYNLIIDCITIKHIIVNIIILRVWGEGGGGEGRREGGRAANDKDNNDQYNLIIYYITIEHVIVNIISGEERGGECLMTTTINTIIVHCFIIRLIIVNIVIMSR